jgi:hypothetical protein
MVNPDEPALLQLLQRIDDQLRDVTSRDELFNDLDLAALHGAHGVAGRVQDRVIGLLTRLTREVANREDRT